MNICSMLLCKSFENFISLPSSLHILGVVHFGYCMHIMHIGPLIENFFSLFHQFFCATKKNIHINIIFILCVLHIQWLFVEQSKSYN